MNLFQKIAYSSHIPTPGAAGSSFSSSSNNIPSDQSTAGSYAYSPSMNITPVTPSAQYAPMSTAFGLFYLITYVSF